jgi:hypothetical protein
MKTFEFFSLGNLCANSHFVVRYNGSTMSKWLHQSKANHQFSLHRTLQYVGGMPYNNSTMFVTNADIILTGLSFSLSQHFFIVTACC